METLPYEDDNYEQTPRNEKRFQKTFVSSNSRGFHPLM